MEPAVASPHAAAAATAAAGVDGGASTSAPSAAAAAAAAAAAGAELLSRPQFAPFLADDFNAAEFTSHILAASRTSAAAQAEQLKGGVRQLEAALSSAVLARHGELLGHARKLADTERSLQDVVLSVASLQASLRRVRAEVEGPTAAVRAKTRQLAAVHATVALLRRLTARLRLVGKLRAQLAAAPALLDLAKAAKLLSDVAALGREDDEGGEGGGDGSGGGGGDLSGLVAAEADEAFLQEAGASIRNQAQAHLIDGMESLSQARVGSALQVFFNLGELEAAVGGVLAQHLHEVERGFKQALDSRHLSMQAAAAAASAASGAAAAAGAGGGPGGARGLVLPTPNAAGGWQERLWASLKAAADALASGALAVWHLQRVVAKKRDPLSHVLFLDVVCPHGSPSLTERYWRDALRALADAFAAAARPSKGGFVRDALAAQYPRLAATLEQCHARVAAESRLRGVPPAAGPHVLPALLDAAAPFRDAYLAASLGRMQEAVGAAFAGSGARAALPSPADVQRCIGALHDEARQCGGSAHLAGLLGGAVGRALRLLADKAEYMAAAGPELRQVALGPAAGGGANASQARNIALCSQLQEVHRSLVALLPRLPPSAAAALTGPLDVLHGAAVDMVAPIFKSALDAFEGHVLALHSLRLGDATAAAAAAAGGEGAADGGAAAAAPPPPPPPPPAVVETSAYVGELANAIAAFRSEFLLRFIPAPGPAVPSVGSALAETAAARLLTLWLRHACLVRPLGQQGKLQLAKDLAEMQLLVGQALYPLEALGAPHRALRAFRALLFTPDEQLAAAACVRELPPALVLHHLFARLPAGVPSPAQRSGVSPQQYSRWLDKHTAADAARGVAGALEAAKQEAAAAAAADAGARAVLALMRQLAAEASAAAPAS